MSPDPLRAVQGGSCLCWGCICGVVRHMRDVFTILMEKTKAKVAHGQIGLSATVNIRGLGTRDDFLVL